MRARTRFRIVGRGFAADADMAAVAPPSFDGQADHLLDAGIALIEVEGDDVGIGSSSALSGWRILWCMASTRSVNPSVASTASRRNP